MSSLRRLISRGRNKKSGELVALCANPRAPSIRPSPPLPGLYLRLPASPSKPQLEGLTALFFSARRNGLAHSLTCRQRRRIIPAAMDVQPLVRSPRAPVHPLVR